MTKRPQKFTEDISPEMLVGLAMIAVLACFALIYLFNTYIHISIKW